MAAHYNSQQVAPLTACFRQYEAQHPGIRILFQQVSYEDFFQTVMISRAGRSPVDIYNLYSIWAPQLIGTGALDAPPADIDRFVRANYTAPTIGAATVKGRLWGIPAAVSVYQLVYNKKLLAAAGFTAPPKTLDELIKVAGAITNKNRQGNILTAGYATDLSGANIPHVFYSEMYASGSAPYAADMRHTNLRSPVAVAILTKQVELFRRGITSYSVLAVDFAGGGVGMAIMANWMKDTLRASLGPRFEDTVGVAPVPTSGPGGTMIYSFLWGVDAASQAKRQSWDLLRWLNSPRGKGGLSCTGATLAGMGDLTGNRSDLAAMRGSIAGPFSQQFVRALSSPGAVSQANLWHAAEVDRLFEILYPACLGRSYDPGGGARRCGQGHHRDPGGAAVTAFVADSGWPDMLAVAVLEAGCTLSVPGARFRLWDARIRDSLLFAAMSASQIGMRSPAQDGSDCRDYTYLLGRDQFFLTSIWNTFYFAAGTVIIGVPRR